MNPSSHRPRLIDMILPSTDRLCEACGDPLKPKPKTSLKEWERKRYCNNICRSVAMVRRNADRAGYLKSRQLHIPDSARRVATWDGVPQSCPHCGGLWRYLSTSVCCRTCGRDLYVSAALPG